MNRSTWASGSGYVPSDSIGFWVAITRNGRGTGMALGADRDLALLHDLEQRGLDLGRGAVDLVGEQEVREDRPELGVERVAVGAVDAGADEVGRDEVRGELDPLERRVEDVGEGLDRQRLGEARHALEEEVAAGEQRDEDPLEHRVLADDHAPDLVEDGLAGRPPIEGGGWLRSLRRGGHRLELTGRVGHGNLHGPLGSGTESEGLGGWAPSLSCGLDGHVRMSRLRLS